jgi:hypothetical protein
MTPAFGHHEDRTPTHGYAVTREAAMASVRQELAARELAASGSRARSGCEASRNRKNFPVIYSSPVRCSSRSTT